MFNRIKEAISSFMYGRYGRDSLGMVFIVAALILDILSIVLKVRWLYYIGLFFLFLYIYRAFSRDILRRERENELFKAFIKAAKLNITKGRDAVYIVCTGCGTVIRLPKNRGKLEVRCTRCGKVRRAYTGRRKFK